MTHRDEQSMRRWTKSTHIADSARYAAAVIMQAPRRTGLAIRFLRFDGVVDVQQAPNSAANCGRVTNAWLVP
jgi:hypothetical protein